MTHQQILDFAAWIKAVDIIFYGSLVAMIRDEASDTYREGGTIVRPDTHKQATKTGTVVALGKGLIEAPEDVSVKAGAKLEGLTIGDHVVTNVYNAFQMLLPDRDGTQHQVFVYHADDIYVGHQHGTEVELA